MNSQMSPIESLFERLNAHIEEQQTSLADHQRFLAAIDHPVARLLVNEVVDSKNRHQALLRRIAISLRDALQWTHSPEALPRVAHNTESTTRRERAILHDLVSNERKLEGESRKL